MENFRNEFTQRKQETLETTGTISFPSLSKYDFHFTHFHGTQLLSGIMWRSYCTKLHPIKSRNVESTCSSFKAQNISSNFCKELLKQIIWK